MASFAITTDAGEFAVEQWAAPPARLLPREDRTCRVALTWTPDGLRTDDRGCPSVVAREAAHAVARWTVRAPAGLAGAHDLGEVWFVYPFEPGGEVRVLVRQSESLRLTLPEGVDAVPFAIRAWSFVRYPTEAHHQSNPPVTCRVDVAADARGIATEVRADGCAEPFRAAAEGAVSQWRFDPPLVHGEPIPSALTLTATFDPVTPARTTTGAPSDESHRLWADRQFDQLTREERIWFIRATLLGPDLRDLGPGHVRVGLPGIPDLGGRSAPDFFSGDGPIAFVPALPDHPPVLVLGKPEHVAIEVFALPMPEPGAVDAAARGTRCDLLVQVDAERRVFSWAEACDPAARELALATADRWILRHDGTGHAERARFRATLRFDEDGRATLVLDADELRTDPDALPEGVHTFRAPRPIQRVPPRLPRDVALPNAACRIAVTVDRSGRATDAEILECPPGFEDAARRSVERWRWSPAEEDGVAVPSETVVTIRFGT